MKTRFVVLSLLVVCAVNAQTIKVKNHKLVSSRIEQKAFHPVFNSDGTKLLFTSDNYVGLNLYDFNTDSVKTIATEEGTGFSPTFSNDGKKIYYRQVDRKDGRLYKTLMSFDSGNQTRMKLSQPVRTTKELNTIRRKAMKGRSATSSISVCTEDLKIVLYKNGVRKEMEPLGKVAGYIWASLSPDGKMILFTAASKGTYVCDLSGKVIASLGKVNAPVWYNNYYVVGMDDKDDGSVITSSGVVIVSLDGKTRQTLTPEDRIAMYPAASSSAGRIAYCTADGKIYVMDIDINK